MARIRNVWTTRIPLLLALVGLLVVPMAGPNADTAVAVEVIADDEIDAYSGSGSVLFPVGVGIAARQRGSDCPGCRWKVTKPCQRTDDHQDAGCRGMVLGCPQGREIQRAWLAVPGRDFEPVGLFCPSSGEAVAVAVVQAQVRGSFTHRLPSLRPTCQPARGVVVGIPVHCRAGQHSGAVSWTDSVAGQQVTTSARAAWTWTFQDHPGLASRQQVDFPGEPYPRPGIQHRFRMSGPGRVAVEARWRGEFTVAGLGPFAVEPDVTQRAELTIPVGSAVGAIRG